jgi:hypothetical protein
MLLEPEIVLEAARELLRHAIVDVVEDEDSTAALCDGDDVYDLTNRIISDHRDRVLYVMGYLVGRISEAWGCDVALVFHHMGLANHLLDDTQQVDMLYRLLMSCFGHGIAIDDDGPRGLRAKAFDAAGKKLLNLSQDAGNRFDPTPLYFEMHSSFVDELVTEHLRYSP